MPIDGDSAARTLISESCVDGIIMSHRDARNIGEKTIRFARKSFPQTSVSIVDVVDNPDGRMTSLVQQSIADSLRRGAHFAGQL